MYEIRFIINNSEENWLEQKVECIQYVIINVELAVTSLPLHPIITN
jgi:hypothetical protein